jgi:hypothetical protein
MQFDQLKRREFITLLGGAAAVWPLAVRAQQPAMPVIGFVSSLAHSDLGLVIPGFQEGLNTAGFVEGRNIAIEYRWAEGDYQRLPALSADLVDKSRSDRGHQRHPCGTSGQGGDNDDSDRVCNWWRPDRKWVGHESEPARR